jgi:capsular polysaccharide biosynthesis protein
MDQEIVLRAQSIVTLAQAGAGVWHARSLSPERIDLPELPSGHVFFKRWTVRETPDQGAWAQSCYETAAPPLFVLSDVLVHASAGILAVGDGHVIAETIEHTDPARHGYRRLARGIGIVPRRTARLPGTHVSVLTPGAQSYEGALLTGLGRLSAVPDSYLLQAESLLIPAGGRAQTDMLRLLDLLPSVAPREVSDDETLLVERLILPLSVGGDMLHHPCLLGFFGRLSGAVPPASSPLPQRIFVAQHKGAPPSIRNEAEIAAALQPLGFTAVQTDTLDVAQQIQLFRQAEAIVAPQGPALANLGFCRPGTIVVELMSTEDVNWRFRYLAALAGLHYDCVLGLDGIVSPVHAAASAANPLPRNEMAA